MPDVPKYETKGRTRHQWTIGHGEQPIDAKNFTFGINSAQQSMRELGIDLSYDDAYFVEAGDSGEVILFVEIGSDEAEDLDSEALKAVRKLLEIHREGNNEVNRHDHWPSGHCNEDGETWPCRTAKILGVDH